MEHPQNLSRRSFPCRPLRAGRRRINGGGAAAVLGMSDRARAGFRRNGRNGAEDEE